MSTHDGALGSAGADDLVGGSCRPARANQPWQLLRHAWGSEECCLDGKHMTLRKLHIEDGATLVLRTPLRQEEAWIVMRGQVELRSAAGRPQAQRDGAMRTNPGEVIRVTALGPVTLLAVSSHNGQGGTLILGCD